MVFDMIEYYEGYFVFWFFCDFDFDCDELRVLVGELGEFVVVVWKVKQNYFLGVFMNEELWVLFVSFDFLEKGKIYKVIIYVDGEKVDWKINLIEYQIMEQEVIVDDMLNICMVVGGG